MTREQIEAFVKKHMVAIIAIGGGAIIVIIILIKRAQASSSQQGATLDTIHQDLKTIDFDLNQIDTNLDTFPVSPPAETPPTPKPTPKPVPPKGGPIPPQKPPASSDANHPKPPESSDSKHKKHKKKGKGGGFSWLVPQNRRAATLDIPDPHEEQGMGLGGFVSNHADQWAVVDSWALVGEEDYRIFYDNLFSDGNYGFPGDADNLVRLN